VKKSRLEDPNYHRRIWFIRRYRLCNTKRTMLKLRISFMDQLDRCKDDESRRLLLGVSR